MKIFGMGESHCDPNRILIVDDEAQIRRLFNMIVSSLPGVTVDLACNGVEAVRLFREKHYGIVTMDVRMPVMGGVEAFRAIEKICEEDKIKLPPFIFCTGFAPTGEVGEIVGDGDYHMLLLKPAMSSAILDAVQSRIKIVKP